MFHTLLKKKKNQQSDYTGPFCLYVIYKNNLTVRMGEGEEMGKKLQKADSVIKVRRWKANFSLERAQD